MRAAKKFPLDNNFLHGRRVVAFSGVGDTSSFHRAVEGAVEISVVFIDLDNHFNYLNYVYAGWFMIYITNVISYFINTE